MKIWLKNSVPELGMICHCHALDRPRDVKYRIIKCVVQLHPTPTASGDMNVNAQIY